MIAHQHQGVHLPLPHHYAANAIMHPFHHPSQQLAYGGLLPHTQLVPAPPYAHQYQHQQQRMNAQNGYTKVDSSYGTPGGGGEWPGARSQMHSAYAQQAQAQAQHHARAQAEAHAQARAQQEYYASKDHQLQRAVLGASVGGGESRHAMGSVYNHTYTHQDGGNAALPPSSYRPGNGDGDCSLRGGAANVPPARDAGLAEERAHLDRLFSALAAAHPNPLSHHSSSNGPAASAVAASFAADGNGNGYSQSEVALGRSYAARMNAHEAVHQRPQQAHEQPLWASTGHNHVLPAHQLSLPPPSYPTPHQGTGLQPAFDFGPAQVPRLPSSLFQMNEREVEKNSSGSARQYNEALFEQERRNRASVANEQAKRNEVAAAAAAWADYAVQQQHQAALVAAGQAHAHAQAQDEANALVQMQLAEVVLPDKEFTLDDEPQLIPTDASAIPPPPPIEKSAHPLAALATDLVWEAFLSAASSNSAYSLGGSPSVPSSGSQSPMYLQHQGRAAASEAMNRGNNGSSRTSPFPGYAGGVSTYLGTSVSMPPRTPGQISSARKSHIRSTSKSLSPSSGAIGRFERATSVPRADSDTPASSGTANVYGAIGGERRPRHGSTLATRHDASPGSRSDSSSPASTAPGTPASSSATTNCIVKTSSETSLLGSKMGKRLSGGLPWASGEDADSFSNMNKDIYQAGLLKNPVQYQQGQTQAQQQAAYQRFAQHLSPPTSLFEQIQKLLGATLLSQQVLLLALYFVAKTPHTCPLYPPATSQSALKSTSAPFKLLLAALVVANKHLDDNSFRNSTFAQVANVTLPEVNALEFSMLSSLDFDINVPSSDWLAWLRDLQYQRTTRFTQAQAQVVNVEDIITPLIDGVLAHQEEHARLFTESKPASRRSSESSPERASERVNSAMDSAMLPPSPNGSDASRAFDMDAAGPLEVEQRPQYSKAFGSSAASSASAFKQQQLGQQRTQDEPMFFTSGFSDDETPQDQGGYPCRDMPADPYASQVPF